MHYILCFTATDTGDHIYLYGTLTDENSAAFADGVFWCKVCVRSWIAVYPNTALRIACPRCDHLTGTIRLALWELSAGDSDAT